jgi:hypothetical protein
MVKRINRRLLDEVKASGGSKRKLFVWDEGDGSTDAEIERVKELNPDAEIVAVRWIGAGEPEPRYE